MPSYSRLETDIYSFKLSKDLSARHIDTSRTRRSVVWPRPRLRRGSSVGSSSDNGISLLLQICSIANRTVGAGRARNPPDLLEDSAGSQEGSRASRMGAVVGKEGVPGLRRRCRARRKA